MQTVSVTIDRFVEDKFEHLLNEYGYEFSKHYDCSSGDCRSNDCRSDDCRSDDCRSQEQHPHPHWSAAEPEVDEVSFVLTSEEEFDLIELGMLNECARQIQQLENLDLENFKNLLDNPQSPQISDRSLLNAKAGKFSN